MKNERVALTRLTTAMRRDTTLDRFVDKVIIRADGCWQWTAALNSDGYGFFCITAKKEERRRHINAHRFAYLWLRGPIPDGLTLDHLCRNRQCVNPEHLEPVTVRENSLRGQGPTAVNAVKTHCPQGHPYDDTNTYLIPGGTGRGCRACRREEVRVRRAQRKVEASV